jgi:rubredoxin
MDRNGPMRRVCPNCAQLMALVRRTRDLRATYAIFNFECESCGVGYTEADDSERKRAAQTLSGLS